MLVLSRKPGEKIYVDGPCVIELLETKGSRSRIGITAEPSVVIEREEVRERRTGPDNEQAA